MASPVKPGILKKKKSSAISPRNSGSKLPKLKSSESKDTRKDIDDDDDESTSSSSYSDSDSDSDSNSLKNLFPPTTAPTTVLKRKNQHESETEPEPSILPPLFSLPPNSTPLQTTSSSSTSPFAKTNLSGKHLWLITCPSHIPLSSLSGTRVPFSQLTTGEPFLEHKGLMYGLHPNSDNPDGSGVGVNLLVPIPGGTTEGSYGVSPIRFQRAFRLTAAPPKLLQNGSERAVKGPQKKQVHTQPEGLQMRYQPFGAGPTLRGGNIFGGDNDLDVNFRELESVNGHVNDTADFTPRKKKSRIEKHGEDGKRRKKNKTEKLNGNDGEKERKKKKEEDGS